MFHGNTRGLPDWTAPFEEKLRELDIYRGESEAWSDEENAYSTLLHHAFFSEADGSMLPNAQASSSIQLFVVREALLRAVALTSAGHTAVGVSTGLMANLRRTVIRAVEAPVFRDNVEWVDDGPVDFIFEDLWRDVNAPDAWRMYAEQLFLQCLQFVSLHEKAHIERNHFALLVPESDDLRLIDELALFDGEPDKTLRHRLCEVDADLCATNEFLECIGDSPEHAEAQALSLSIAAVLVFLTLDGNRRPIVSYRDASHPAPVNRAMLVTDYVVDYLNQVCGIDQESAAQVRASAWRRCAAAAADLGAIEGRWWGKHERFTGRSEYDRVRVSYVTHFGRLSSLVPYLSPEADS